MMPCPAYDKAVKVSAFDNTLTGPPKPASWPWIKTGLPDVKNRGSSLDRNFNSPVYTWILSDGHTGSTALAGLIATSPQVATLCTSGVANCEGEKILMYMTKHMEPLTDKQRGNMKRGAVYDMNWIRVIREYHR
jgi:hypothetical protein